MMVSVRVDELQRHEGSRFGPGSWLEIDQSRIDMFSAATNDHQWIHVDVQRAADGPYKGTIAHGMLTLSLLLPLVAEIIEVDHPITINYGFDKVRFLDVVGSGDSIAASATLEEVTVSDRGTRVRFGLSAVKKSSGRLALVAEWLVFYPLVDDGSGGPTNREGAQHA